ncbi:S-adenosyl-L-methionine-dependent methyltransferase [Cubamyces lactineus]|nr:S-adenosyl-L-methionine-dependent methyltransferase [Cubamyces lactineus]
MSTFETLRALHGLIGDALGEIENVYRTQPGPTGPLDFPSLDKPYYKTAAHSPELEIAEKLTSDPAVVDAANRIVAACGQLSASVHKPFFQLTDAMMSDHLASCIEFLEESHTVEILRKAGDAGMHVRDIARTIDDLRHADEPLDPAKLSHILRLLATYHWLREVKPDVFANNRLSALVDSGKTLEQLRDAPEKKHDGTDGIAALVAMTGDEFLKAVAHLTDQLLPTRERARTLRAILDKDHKGALPEKYKTPFNLAFRTELGYFDWLELPENKSRLAEFGRAMTGARAWEISENIVTAFPWKDLPENSVVIDVGGGIGSSSMVLAKAYPHLRFVVEDREHVIEIAPSLWDASHAELIKSGRVSFKAHSFFTPQPPTIDVPGVGAISAPSVYLVRGCTHNWPDEDLTVSRMLRHLRNAAQPTTQLLVVDMILPLACVDTTEVAEPIPGAVRSLAPEGSPLLANLGKASVNGYLLDLSMIAMLNAKERTLWEISDLARAAGWKVTGTTRGSGSLWAYTSARPI